MVLGIERNVRGTFHIKARQAAPDQCSHPVFDSGGASVGHSPYS